MICTAFNSTEIQFIQFKNIPYVNLVDQIQPKKREKLIQIPSVLRKIVKVFIFMIFSITDQAELRWYIFALLLQSYIFFFECSFVCCVRSCWDEQLLDDQ